MSDAVFGGVRCRPGARARGVLEAAPTYAAPGQLPVGVVHGAQPGPAVAVIAGVHGSEYAGIEAATRLFGHLDPERLAGTVVVVPVANVAAFHGRTALVNPTDGLNLNRVFPGDGGRTVSHRLARRILEEIVVRCDAVLDLHGADLGEALVPTVTVLEHDDGSGDDGTWALARAYGVEYVRRRTATSAAGTLVGEARRRGIPALMCELGSGGVLEEDEVKAHLRGALAALAQLGLVEGPLPGVENVAQQRVTTHEELVACERGGVFQPLVGLRQAVAAGDAVVEIRDLWGSAVETIRVEHAGVVRLMFLRRVVEPGQALLVTMREVA